MSKAAVVPFKCLHIEQNELASFSTWHVPGTYAECAKSITKVVEPKQCARACVSDALHLDCSIDCNADHGPESVAIYHAYTHAHTHTHAQLIKHELPAVVVDVNATIPTDPNARDMKSQTTPSTRSERLPADTMGMRIDQDRMTHLEANTARISRERITQASNHMSSANRHSSTRRNWVPNGGNARKQAPLGGHSNAGSKAAKGAWPLADTGGEKIEPAATRVRRTGPRPGSFEVAP